VVNIVKIAGFIGYKKDFFKENIKFLGEEIMILPQP
jgi:hypothetical protein